MTPEAAILAGLSAAQYRPGMTVVRFRFSLSLSLSLSPSLSLAYFLFSIDRLPRLETILPILSFVISPPDL